MKYLYTIPIMLLLLSDITLKAQEAGGDREQADPIEPVMEMTYLKDTYGRVNLRVSMVNYVERMAIPLGGLEIGFYSGEDSLALLGSAVTDADGTALLVLEHPVQAAIPGSEVRYVAGFTGNEGVLPAEYEIYISDVNLEMNLEMVDSVGTVRLRAYTLLDGEKTPVADEDIYVYVARMFNDLPIAEDFLDENGEFEVKVPDDIPGDIEGNIEIIARFNDHYLFGTVEKRQSVRWGVPTDPHIPISKRTLWTQIAPLWMIITLSIMLTGVWSHYIYVIVQLVRIKHIARKEEQTNTV